MSKSRFYVIEDRGASLDRVTRQVADELTYSFDYVNVHKREWMSIILCHAKVGAKR